MTYSMSTAAARKASKKTQHVRSAGDWITLILLVAGALLVLFPLLVLTVNAFKTSADYNATGPLSLPKHFTMEGIISFWTTTNFPLKFWNSFIISLVVAVAAVVLSVLNSFALGIGKVKGNTWIVLGIMLANMMPQEALLYPLYTMFKQVGLYNTKLAIIIIFTIIQSAYGTYLLSSVYGTFPQAILEAAAIDGASLDCFGLVADVTFQGYGAGAERTSPTQDAVAPDTGHFRSYVLPGKQVACCELIHAQHTGFLGL